MRFSQSPADGAQGITICMYDPFVKNEDFSGPGGGRMVMAGKIVFIEPDSFCTKQSQMDL